MSARQLIRSALLLRRGALLLREEAAALASCHTRSEGDWAGEPDAQRAHAELTTTAAAMEAQAVINEHQSHRHMTEVISIERIEREARDAAHRGESLNDACPYPFGTDAAHHFQAVYQLALLVKRRPAQEPAHG